jgi:hypothetical protein
LGIPKLISDILDLVMNGEVLCDFTCENSTWMLDDIHVCTQNVNCQVSPWWCLSLSVVISLSGSVKSLTILLQSELVAKSCDECVAGIDVSTPKKFEILAPCARVHGSESRLFTSSAVQQFVKHPSSSH